VSASEQTIVAGAMQSLWQHVDQEATGGLGRAKCHRDLAGRIIARIDLDPERDSGRNWMLIAGNIFEMSSNINADFATR